MRAQAPEFGDFRGHWKENAHAAGGLHREQAAQLVVEQIGTHLRETDAAQAERRVFLRRQRQIVDFLVGAHVERA